ncbi:MAG: hypothetical protein ACI4S2_06500 [Lachnospiraceae bacterium]
MDGVYEIREKLREIYAEHSIVFDKGAQFLIALVTFYLINNNVGFVKAAASPVVTLALSVICTFFPVIITVIVATALILLHMYGVSLGVLAVTVLVFLIMYVFYFRLTPKMALVVVLTPIAFAFKIPFVVPLAYALISTPISMVAIACGTIVYFMMQYVKKAAPGFTGADAPGITEQVSTYIKQVFQNKEMWIAIITFMIAFLVIYTLRRQSMNHAWKIAMIVGAVINVILNAAGDIALGVHTSYGALILGSVLAVAIGFVLELFFFSVDYARSENLQYEDDEYYYYVKAVPKLAVTKSEKTVKRINGHRETEIMDTDSARGKRDRSENSERRNSERRSSKMHDSSEQRAKRSSKARRKMDDIDEVLLKKSMREDLRK